MPKQDTQDMTVKPSIAKSPLARFFAIAVLLVLVATTTIAWGTSQYGWWQPLEILSHFQVQYFCFALLLWGVLCFTRQRSLIFCGLFCCTLLSSQVVPWYLPPKPLLPQPKADLRVLIANINTQNKSFDRVLNLVRKEQPDLALFMEVDRTWAIQFDSLKDVLPYSFGQAAPYNLGILVYSRYPLLEPQVDFFGTEKNASIIAKVAIANQTLSFIGTHPFPPVKPRFFTARNRQLDLVGQAMKSLPGPKMLLGDLNLSMWSPYYRRLIRQTSLSNARNGFGILPSWPTPSTFSRRGGWIESLLSIPIDHCLISPTLQVTNIRLGDETGSDHRPLIVDLRIIRQG